MMEKMSPALQPKDMVAFGGEGREFDE